VRSIDDLINCEEGRSETSGFHVGKEDEMRLSKSLKILKMSLGQDVMLIEEDHRRVMIIG